MLKSFCISGYKSIKDEICINLSSSKNQRIKATRYENSYNEKISKIAVLFGKNATGKTSVIEALMDIVQIIKNGNIILSEIAQKMNFVSKEIGFKIEIYKNDISYKYELFFNKEHIIKEKLIENESVIYKYDGIKLTTKNNELKNINISSTHKTAILDVLRSINHKNISNFINNFDNFYYPVMEDFFLYMPQDIRKKYIYPFMEFQKEILEQNKELALEILSFVDNSIDDFYFIDNNEDRYSLLLKRNGFDYTFENESSGIKKIFMLLASIIITSKNGGVCVLDELDNSISASSLIYFINGFINTSENKAQFIFTSHNILIFDTSILHSSQIFITTKENLKTSIASLNEFELRNDKKKAYLDYLRGDYE